MADKKQLGDKQVALKLYSSFKTKPMRLLFVKKKAKLKTIIVEKKNNNK